MRKVKEISALELYTYGHYDSVSVKFIMFDKMLKPHVMLVEDSLETLYDKTICDCDANLTIMNAKIKWFFIDGNTLVICLKGKYEDGIFQFVNN